MTANTIDKIPLSQMVLYALAGVALIPAMQIIDRLALFVLETEVNIKPSHIGWALFLFRIWDAFTDPFFGNYSDNYRSKLGRRKPFIILGGILCALSFPLIWMISKQWSPTVALWFFVATGLIYYTALTIYTVPYFSLANEMSRDTHERTKAIAYRGFVSTVVTIAMGWLIWFITLDIFDNKLEGVFWLAITTSVCFLTFGIIPVLFVKEPLYEQVTKQEKVKLWDSIKATVTSRVLMVLVAMMLLMTLGMQTVGTLGFYVSLHHVFGGNEEQAALFAGYGGTLFVMLSVISIPIFVWISKRFGKITALYASGICYLLGTISQWFLITPSNPYLGLISAGLIGPVVTGIWILFPAMQADATDHDELITGCRREGGITAIFGWIQKLGFALSVLLSGYILDFSGYDGSIEGVQSAETVTNMRLLFVTFPVVMATLMIFLIRFYPLTEKRCLEIKEELEHLHSAKI